MLRIVALMVSLFLAFAWGSPFAANPSAGTKTAVLPPDKLAEKERNQAVIDMAEKRLGVIVLPVTEDIRKELNLRAAEGVAVIQRFLCRRKGLPREENPKRMPGRDSP